MKKHINPGKAGPNQGAVEESSHPMRKLRVPHPLNE